MTINVELEKLYEAEKEQREDIDVFDPAQYKKFESDTEIRISKVKQMLVNDEIDTTEIWNLHYAAYLLQHSTLSQDYQLANEFAEKAVKLGSRVSRWLCAATLDRYLLSMGKPQKFGTQYKFENNEWVTQPVEKSTTDREREEYGVQSLERYLTSKYE